MSDGGRIDELVGQFRAYLEQAGEQEGEAADDTAEAPGLYALFEALAGLRTEVRQESRQSRETLERLKEALALVHKGADSAARDLERARAREESLRRELLRPLLLQLLDLHDRLEAGSRFTAEPRRRRWFQCRSDSRRLAAIAEGQALTLGRLLDLLAGYRVRPIEALGQPFDPNTMRALETDSIGDRRAGEVTAELRRGFTWEGELLRLTDVRVNKGG